MSPIDEKDYDLAISYFTNGNINAAELVSKKIISANKNHAFALGLLGLIELMRNELDSAYRSLTKAIKLRPDIAAFYNNLGEVHRRREEFQMAHDCFRAALSLSPENPDVLCNVGGVLLALDRVEEAKLVLQEAHRLGPNSSQVQKLFGDLCIRQKKYSDAVIFFSKALVLDSRNIGAMVNLSICFEEIGDLQRARDCLERTLQLDPSNVDALCNFGNILQKERDFVGSVELYNRALVLDSSRAETHHNLSLALSELNRTGDAIASLMKAISIRPGYREARYLLGDIFAANGWTHEAREVFNSDPDRSVGMRIRAATLVPAIYQSEEAITVFRSQFDQVLDDLLSDDSLLLAEPVAEIRDTAFYLSYHGLNNRILKEKLAAMFAKACPSLLYEARHVCTPRNPSKPIKLGIISRYLYDHSIGKTTVGLVEHLSRETFNVYTIFIGKSRGDGIAERLKYCSDEVVELHDDLELARLQVESLELDILFYQDIGMEPFSYFLAFSRLARIQCTSFGHPDTTGIRNIDYFVSSDLFEGDCAKDHYSEKLFLLNGVGTLAYYHRSTEPPALADRSAFGLPNAGNIYLCAQSLFKLHPGFDSLMAGILRADPSSHIVLLVGSLPHLAALLQERWNASIPDVANRFVFVASRPYSEFLQLLKLAVVALDVPSFNGMNSSLDAFLMGTPVVTMPGYLQRTRHTFGMYKCMGIDECIATSPEEYVDICIRLGLDHTLRNYVKSRILENNHLLFEDKRVVSEFSRFFVEALTSVS